MDNCIFCKIIKGELPCYKVWEDEKHLAFLTIKPQKKGHTLVIPRNHSDYFFDLEDKDLADIVIACKKVSRALKKAFKPSSGKISMLLMGQGVPHVHVHLFPLDNESDVDPKKAYDADEKELKDAVRQIKDTIV